MTAYLWVVFVIGVVGVLFRLIVLSGSDYPRTLRIKMGSDVVGLLFAIGFTIWSGILLFR